RLELSAFFGDEPSQEVQVAQMDGATQGRLTQLDQQMSAHGFTRVGDPAGVVVTTSDPRDFQLNLQERQCYAFAALGGPGARQTDIALNDAGGQQLSTDTVDGQDAVIQYCAPATGSYSLSVRLAEGQGSLFTVGYVQNAAQATQTQPVIASTSTAGA